jgi:glycosyltransferase involved in cell wall biosynthesis
MFVFNPCTHDARVLKEAGSLARAGHTVRVCAVQAPGVPDEERRDGFLIRRFAARPFRLLRLLFNAPADVVDYVLGRRSALRRRPAIVPGPAGAAEELDRPSPTVPPGPLGRLTRAVYQPFHLYLRLIVFSRRALRDVRREPADVYHCHDLPMLPLGAAARFATRGSRLVYDAHELFPEMSLHRPWQRRFYAWLERRFSPRADAVITINTSIAGELVARYGVRAPTILMNCPVAPAGAPRPAVRSRLRAALDVGDATPVVLYQGGLSANRGLENLVRAARHWGDAVLVFMGAGLLEPGLRALVRSEGLEHKVRLIPPVPYAELLEHTKGADVGVIPYLPIGLNNTLCTPNKLFEYIVAGIPVAASDLPELRRIIDGYGLGATFDPYSPEAIARAVATCLERRGEMAARARAAAPELSWERQELKLLALYKSLAPSRAH